MKGVFAVILKSTRAVDHLSDVVRKLSAFEE